MLLVPPKKVKIGFWKHYNKHHMLLESIRTRENETFEKSRSIPSSFLPLSLFHSIPLLGDVAPPASPPPASPDHGAVAPPVQFDAASLTGSIACLSYGPVISTSCSYQLTKSVITLLIYISGGERRGVQPLFVRHSLVSASFSTDPNVPTCTASTVH